MTSQEIQEVIRQSLREFTPQSEEAYQAAVSAELERRVEIERRLNDLVAENRRIL